MTFPSDLNPINLSDLQNTLGGSNPISLSEYYAGGVNTPSGLSGTAGAIPSSGLINLNKFRGANQAVVKYRGAYSVSTITGGETVIVFLGGGSIIPYTKYNLQGLIVGGGGGGGGSDNDRSGGGGAGGVATYLATPTWGSEIAITIGAGGARGIQGSGGTAGYAGGSSSFGSRTAGGGLGGMHGQGNYGWGASGGNSGSPQSYAGGPNGGGGAGAGGAAANAGGTGAAPGGVGYLSSITGISTYYAGGGGGGASGGQAGGSGGGGTSGNYRVDGNPGTYYGAGGGGSGGYAYGGAGYQGIVIIRGMFQAIAY